jgi:Transposase DDE domain
VDSTLLEVLHPRQVRQSAGWGSSSERVAWVRWGSFSVYGVKLHLMCATNRVPISYELTPANIADICLTEELLAEAALGEGVARRLLGDLAYSSENLKKSLAEVGILLATERAERRRGVRQHIEIAISSLKRVFGLGETLATTLVGLATRSLRQTGGAPLWSPRECRGTTHPSWWCRTTRRDPLAAPAPDLLRGGFVAGGPNKVWLADISPTYRLRKASSTWPSSWTPIREGSSGGRWTPT